jgi:sugar phosphate isomerase/epimerase
MHICLLTDEISADPETAIELGVAWGVHDFELRGYFTDRAPLFSPYQKERLRSLLAEYNARIVSLGPGLFKMPLPAAQSPQDSLAWLECGAYERWAEAQRLVHYHLEVLLPTSLEYARELGIPRLAIFGFDRSGAPPGNPPSEAIEILRQAACQADAYGVELVLENEAGFWADTGQRTAQIIRLVDHPALGVNWDPGNAFFAGDCPYPDGYSAVRGLVRHVHFKDACRDPESGEFRYTLDGQIDWAGQIMALASDGYSGFISIETHLRPKVDAARLSLKRLKRLIELS